MSKDKSSKKDKVKIDKKNKTSAKKVKAPKKDAEGRDKKFDLVIGHLQFVLAKMMQYAVNASVGQMTGPNRQTLKHHAEDMIACGESILKKITVFQAGTPQPQKPDYEALINRLNDIENTTLSIMEKLNDEFAAKDLVVKTQPITKEEWDEKIAQGTPKGQMIGQDPSQQIHSDPDHQWDVKSAPNASITATPPASEEEEDDTPEG